MTDLERWPAIRRRIEPLPGGVLALRRRLREPRRRQRWFVATAAATVLAAATLMWLLAPRPQVADRRALDRLIGQRPSPELVARGIAVPRRDDQTPDPRVDDRVVVFRWVSPGEVVTVHNPDAADVVVLDPRDADNQLR